MLFKYTALAKGGKKRTGTIEASDRNDAIAKLKAQGLFSQSIRPYRPPLWSRFKLKGQEKISPLLLSQLSRDLATYLNAGISIVNAIRLATSQYSGQKKTVGFLESIANYLDEGKSFSVALESQEVFEIPFFYRQSIKVSEDGGILAEVLLELSKFLKDQERIKKQIGSAMAYPIFIVMVSIIMVAMMMVLVVPKITGIFEQMDTELPTITKVVITMSDFLGENWHLLAIGFVLFLLLFNLALRMNQSFRYGFDRFRLALPFFGQNLATSELARFSYMASVLMRSGLPFVQVISLSSRILNNTVIRSTFEDAANKVVEGGKLSTALMNADYAIEKSFVQAIALGEETSEVETILSNLSERYFEEHADRIGVFLSLLEPVLMLGVGGSVGFIIAAMLLPIFSLNIG